MQDETDELLAKLTEQGLELARLLSKGGQLSHSAVILGTAVGALYWTMTVPPAPEGMSKEWLNAFFTMMTGGLKHKGVEVDIKWERKDEKK